MEATATRTTHYAIAAGQALVAVLIALTIGLCLLSTSTTTGTAHAVDVSTASTAVQVRVDDVPTYVWDAMLAAHAPSSPTDGCECLYVPLGATYGPTGHQWVASFDGMDPAPTN